MRVILSWSSGKDAAWALWVLRDRGVDVSGLLTTLDEATGRVGLHGVPRDVVEAQAEAAGLPLHTVALPWPAPNDVYEAALRPALAAARDAGATHVAFGDLFLADIRAYRERLVAEAGLAPLFPLWHPPGGTAALAQSMLAGGLRATVTCADASVLDASFVGRPYDGAFLSDLPALADPCGERGEFHTVCTGGPMFRRPLAVRVGRAEERGGFVSADVRAA
ncbi:hypothetical protein RQM47_00820 [Rubrivirga sp. S365]|uniref:Diphthamide synthase domain-containing protein n=1 Tax=Rubrivirga litoralis TaxID=3075598 RepID=A0ABU3BU31_9BACT|nr:MULTISPECIES: hypothetical protein [unclassified Rubrivirga]MDT0632783.1 hypothetical protein [Rubrivirga sp. F394]MDT7855177.1 hypothetical protein [Rubrivirga sp. S365]